ncbi:MAG: hypothetical protein ACRDKE_01025, partial [Solirubrobacterales bacterium]
AQAEAAEAERTAAQRDRVAPIQQPAPDGQPAVAQLDPEELARRMATQQTAAVNGGGAQPPSQNGAA